MLVERGATISSCCINNALEYDTKMEIFKFLLEKSSEVLEFTHIEDYLMGNSNEQLIKILINSNNYNFKSKNYTGDTLLHFAIKKRLDHLLISLIKVSDVN